MAGNAKYVARETRSGWEVVLLGEVMTVHVCIALNGFVAAQTAQALNELRNGG